jgi:hypothetical protein
MRSRALDHLILTILLFARLLNQLLKSNDVVAVDRREMTTNVRNLIFLHTHQFYDIRLIADAARCQLQLNQSRQGNVAQNPARAAHRSGRTNRRRRKPLRRAGAFSFRQNVYLDTRLLVEEFRTPSSSSCSAKNAGVIVLMALLKAISSRLGVSAMACCGPA